MTLTSTRDTIISTWEENGKASTQLVWTHENGKKPYKLFSLFQ